MPEMQLRADDVAALVTKIIEVGANEEDGDHRRFILACMGAVAFTAAAVGENEVTADFVASCAQDIRNGTVYALEVPQ